MVTILVALALIAVFPFVGLLVGLGSDRFWWAMEKLVFAAIWLVGIGLIAGVIIGNTFRRNEK